MRKSRSTKAFDITFDPTQDDLLVFGIRTSALQMYDIPVPRGHHEEVFAGIIKTCTEAGLDIHHVRSITVTNGPGRFSSLRVASVIANMLAWETGCALYVARTSARKAKKVQRVEPFYGKPPSITKSKKK